MATPPVSYAHIVRIPGVVGGEPIIRDTRVPVRSIILLHRHYGEIERVLLAFPRVSRAAVEEALAHYEAHRPEIDRLIAENEAYGGS